MAVHVKFLEKSGFVASDYSYSDDAAGKANFKAAVDRIKSGKHDASHADITSVVLEVDGKSVDTFTVPKGAIKAAAPAEPAKGPAAENKPATAPAAPGGPAPAPGAPTDDKGPKAENQPATND